MSSIAVVGAAGQLGTDLARVLGDRALPVGRPAVDVSVAGAAEAWLDEHRPAAVINCTAYNLVDQAEKEPEAAIAVNGLAPRRLAHWCAAADVPLVHISTDYVYGGAETPTRPLSEEDCPTPVSAYGTSKLVGEQFVRAICPRSLVVRTCGLYGLRPTRGKGNFVETMLRLSAEREELRVVNDQRCTPTCTWGLAEVLVELLDRQAWGLYHATDEGDCTWYEFTKEIVRLAGGTTHVIPIESVELKQPARRPTYSVLSSAKMQSVLGHLLPDWRTALAAHLERRGID